MKLYKTFGVIFVKINMTLNNKKRTLVQILPF